MAILADDILAAILNYVTRGSRQFSADREKLHKAFYALKSANPQAMSAITFRDKGLFPESLALDQALANLEATGLLRRQNDAPRYYFIQDELDKAFRNNIEPRLVSEGCRLDQFEKLAKDFVSGLVAS